MTKNELRSELLAAGWVNYIVVSAADGNGGRQHKDTFASKDPDFIPNLEDFDFIEWQGTPTEVLRDWNKVVIVEEWHHQYDEPDYNERTLGELISELLNW